MSFEIGVYTLSWGRTLPKKRLGTTPEDVDFRTGRTLLQAKISESESHRRCWIKSSPPESRQFPE